MKKYVRFHAVGLIYNRNKEGHPVSILEKRVCTGITLDCRELMGKIFRQCPDLLPCDYVKVHTNAIM